MLKCQALTGKKLPCKNNGVVRLNGCYHCFWHDKYPPRPCEAMIPLSDEERKSSFLTEFNAKIKDVVLTNSSFDGSIGHQVEKLLGISPNSSQEPDYKGLEIKSHGGSKITFFDLTPVSMYGKGRSKNGLTFNANFCQWFGSQNVKKDNRWSWSGKICPSYYGQWSQGGQILGVSANGAIQITYNYERDQRLCKEVVVPLDLRKNDQLIVVWERAQLENALRKFRSGFALIGHNKRTFTNCDVTTRPITYDNFITLFRERKIIFDSGRYATNNRPYSQFRTTTNVLKAFCN